MDDQIRNQIEVNSIKTLMSLGWMIEHPSKKLIPPEKDKEPDESQPEDCCEKEKCDSISQIEQWLDSKTHDDLYALGRKIGYFADGITDGLSSSADESGPLGYAIAQKIREFMQSSMGK